jgi:FdrA protein
VAVNLGLREFAESLQSQDVDVIHVEWSPPAEGDEEIGELLDRLI